MKPIAQFFLLVFAVIIVLVVIAQLAGCSQQYREASREVAEELAFQEAWTSDAARAAERGRK